MHPGVVYLRLKKKVRVSPGQKLRLGDIAQVLADESVMSIVRLEVYRSSLRDGNLVVIDVMDVIERIRRVHSDLDVRSVGPAQTIIETEVRRRVPSAVWVVMIWLLLFVGSGLALMNFHTDVSMKSVHQRIYYLVTGQHDARPLILQIPYSLGIGVGMILFFNHLFKRRFNDEPSPLELEMFLYQENLNQYVIDHEKSKKPPDSP
ncbi:stage V sporulation protein AA [Planifilum fimeticola]|uniref:Stage V sporulation protein AA n=1 Tax=Planifilum fimeticola TaxID=201975 RepID=A0A2T0LD37_9BACL|nr:stage V sporulation protein AA [Planifilum fimeticola]PRX39964.1 stage V sporulation protein AA [Planifilum fimeticola]